MSMSERIAVGLFVSIAAAAAAQEFGQPLTEAEIATWDLSVLPDGTGLPTGQGSVSQGREVYAINCAACHGETGRDGAAGMLVGGIGSLASGAPVKTVGSYWPYATTLFDYVRRAMPYHAPGSLADAEVYAVTAYVLHLNGILPAEAVLDAPRLAAVEMPNRDGFISYWPAPPE